MVISDGLILQSAGIPEHATDFDWRGMIWAATIIAHDAENRVKSILAMAKVG